MLKLSQKLLKKLFIRLIDKFNKIKNNLILK